MSNRELGLPTGATGEKKDVALELMRVWWVDDKPEFMLRAALQDPRNVGRLLGEAAQHFAQVYQAHGEGEALDLLEKIRAGFDDTKAVSFVTNMETLPGKSNAGASKEANRKA